MKHLKLFFALFAMLALGVGNAWGALTEAYSYTFTAKQFSDNTTAKTLGSVKWTPATTWSVGNGYWGYDATKGQQWGSSSHTLNKMILTSGTSFTNVKKITINGSIGSSGGCKLSVKVGGTSIGTEKTLTTTATAYNFESATALTGVVEITLSNGSKKKAQYIKSIIIYTDDTPVGATTYTVTVDGGIQNGTVTASPTEAAEGATVTLIATPNAGYNFDAWDVKDASSNAVSVDANGKFTMPASNVTVSASFVAKNQYSVAWKVNSEDADGGSTSATEGDKVAALPNTPDDCSGDVVFVGWSDQEVSDGNKPALLFTDLAGSPEITGNKTFYAVFAKRTVTTGGTPESVTKTYTFSTYTAGTQYADNEEHVLDDILTLYTTDCHFTSELRIYSSSTYNGYVISNQLPGKIVSLGFNAGNKKDAIIVYGSNDGTTWTEVSEVSITSELYMDYSLSFGENNYTYFKLDVKGANQVRLKSLTLTYQSGDGTSVDYSDYSTSCIVEQDYTITIADDIEHGTVTAPATAKAGATITLTATADENYSFGTWSVSEEGGTAVTVSGNQFTMPEANVTVSATFVENPKWTITWKSVEGSTTTEVYQGKSLGTITEANDCPDGKVFMGWTAANEVNPNGLGITYAKTTDIPTEHTTYNAVYAKETIGSGEEGSAAVALASGVYDSTNKNITWTTDGYATILQAKGSSSSDVNENYIASPRWYVGHKVTITPQSGVNITQIILTLSSTNKDFGHANTQLTNATAEINDDVITLKPINGESPITIVPGAQLRPTAITIHKGPSTSYSHYSFDCEVVNDPYLNVDPTTITFDATNVGFNSTKTIDITAGYLTEDITLAISGANANEFSVSTAKITKDEEVSQEVTVTYAPTAEGNHAATLTITSGTLSKTVALSGSAEVATIYTLTNLADINPNDRVIIVGNVSGETYAMSNAQGTTAAPTAVAVTVVDDKIATNETTILWNISKSGDNLTIYPNGVDTKWLYTADDNNGVRVGTNENKTFTIADGYLKNTSTNRYVGIYNKQNWRCYTSTTTNIAGQTFAFYVLPSTDPVINVTPASKDFGAVIVGNTVTQEFEISTLNVTSALTAEITGDACFTATGINAGKITVTYAPTAVGDYTATLTITAGTEATKTIELKGEAVETVDVATAMAAAKDEIVYLKPFDVVYAVTGKEYVYIKDESGFGLIYDTDLANQLLNGDRVEGFVGKSSPYRSLPELKAHNTENMTITHGTAVEPTEFTTVPATSHVNQYVVFKNVTFDEDVVFNSSTATNATFKLNTNDVTLRNSFKFEVAFEADKAYDIYGAIATYQATESDPIEVQVYYLNSAEAGQEVVTYNVTYDANGASGNVPTDLANYAAGQQVTVAGQGEMTYENHMFTGWKYNGTIYQAGDKFNMPADDVTLVAQWEERQTFSSGLWVLVTDASELAANDYVIIAAANKNVAMQSYETGNNCREIEVNKYGNYFLTWNENIGVFQLAASGSNYTLQDVHTKKYLYAAGASVDKDNHLKASNTIPADENAAKYIWTISIENNVATIKATSVNRNWLRYNSTGLFACYTSGQQDVALYKYVTDFYTRDVNVNNYGTICLPYASSKFAGAEFYEVSWLKTDAGLYLDELAEGAALEAGKPYIFKATDSKITVAYEGDAELTPIAGANGLTGTFTDMAAGSVEGHYIIAQNKVWVANDKNYVNANRAYINSTVVPTTEQAKIPGRRRVCMGENVVTGFEQIVAPEGKAIKVIENGQLIIIRDGVKYNVQGQKL